MPSRESGGRWTRLMVTDCSGRGDPDAKASHCIKVTRLTAVCTVSDDTFAGLIPSQVILRCGTQTVCPYPSSCRLMSHCGLCLGLVSDLSRSMLPLFSARRYQRWCEGSQNTQTEGPADRRERLLELATVAVGQRLANNNQAREESRSTEAKR